MKLPQKQTLNSNLNRPSAPSYYGTAGYRLNTADLNNVLCRASFIAYVRSSTFAGKYIGLYITASHNPVEYNGIKFIDFNGNMLDEAWEQSSDELVNCDNADFMPMLNRLFRQNSNSSGMNDSIYGNVIIGRDTRESGVSITENIKSLLGEMRCNVFDYGVVTCPEMHYLIRKSNEAGEMVPKESYINHLYGCYSDLRELTENQLETAIDTANGVAGVKIDELMKLDSRLSLEVLNDPENGVLNKNCGADYVKVHKTQPQIKKSSGAVVASFDGDVDRLIFFGSGMRLFDGDAQAAYIVQHIKALADQEGIDASFGVILSFYSNMGAVEYLQKSFKVVFAQTGVKNFVREARNFDVGVYYEPNGHGSVHFSKAFVRQVRAISAEKHQLKLLIEMFDPCVGDALANFLVFKAITKSFDSFIKYKENFIRQLTVKIKDKNRIKTDQNNVVLEPDIQKEIDQVVSSFKGRGFVRPSGTEDLVRVFAECSQEMQCDKLALNIAQIVYDNCDGIGPYPEISYNN
ncbi:phosphoacetylglucosamine mutase [Pancytospora philotis]|nr:phosphoacetylglucosamine mutase [Pancytospora philotis]